jgi:uncharacterized repeat protein (TIGR01451 family)
MKIHLSGSLFITAWLCLLGLSSAAALPPERAGLPDFDRRAGKAAVAAADGQQAAVAALRTQVAGAGIDFNEVAGGPKWIRSRDGYLSGPGGEGKGISAAVAAGFATDDPHRAAKAFVQEHQALFGYGPDVLASARIYRDYVTPHNGMKTTWWQQELDGIEVYEAVFAAHTTKAGELIGISSQFLADPAAAANAGATGSARRSQPVITVQQAVIAAAGSLEEPVDLAGVRAMGNGATGAEQRQQFSAQPFNQAIEARLVWLPMNPKQMRLCWEVTLTSHARGETFRLLVDAQTGEVQVRHCLTVYLSEATYRVYTSDSPSPFSPGWSTPNSGQPSLTSRVLVTWSALDTNASPNGWIDDGVNETRGNNVDAHTDRDANDVPDLPRPQGSPSRVFDCPMDLAQSPGTYTNAAVVQLFYWCNFMHDKLYELGFTEAAGNFQNNNFGRGGLGNDALQADAQDGSGYNNANFTPTPDGTPPRIQMYLFNGPTPYRDGDFDAEVVLHEYTHGLSERLVGGGVGISALQTGGMGEGWSDWYAMAVLSEPGDDVNGVYASGGYVTYMLSGMTQNYYFGIRRYPFCTDMTKNPLTFKDIDPAQASSHSGIPRSPIIGNTANEVHNMGEVWCMTLREARANLINKYGWASGNPLIMQLVTDGMKLSPANPNFLQARDAILQADLVDTGGANRNELWAAFAKRGMGFSATSPSSSTTTGLHEAYDIPFQPLQLTVPVSATEGDGVLAGAGQVRLPYPVGTNVVIALSSGDTSEATVPATVTILAGQTNTAFDLTIIDDGVLDGTQTATITASASGFANGYGTISVFDNETATLQAVLPTTAVEGQGTVQGTVQVSAVPAANIVVSLSSSDTTEIQVPTSVTIPAGQTSAVFTATVVDDNQIDGPQPATVTAHVQNWTDGSTTITVLDNESRNMMVTLPASAWENAGVLTNAGSVSISGTLPTDLVVSLVSGTPAKLTVPSSVMISAGQVSNTFSLTLVDNSVPDGHQTVTVTASAPSFTNGSASIFIIDDESPPPPSNPRPGNLAVAVPANTNLMWNNGAGGSNELIINGGFEAGTFDNWLKENSGSGDFVINNGSYDPPGDEVPTPPFAGSFSAVSEQLGGGTHVIYQDITLPSDVSSAVLTWTDRIRNFAAEFTSSQYFHVEIRGADDSLIQVAFTTNPGDPLLNDWVTRSFDLSPYIGQTIRIAFVEVDSLYYLNVHLDNVSVQVRTPTGSGSITNDVYFGTNPTPGPGEFQGSTTGSSWTLPLLAPLTTYYWQIIAHKGGTATGPVWQFTTAGVDHFVWGTVFSPQAANQPFSTTITAKDASNTTVSNFTGTVSLHGFIGSAAAMIFNDGFEDGDFSDWNIGLGSYTRTVTDQTAAVGQYSLTQIGGANHHFDGVWHSLSNATPSRINFYVRASSTSVSGGYFVIGDGATVGATAVWFYMTPDGMGIYENVGGPHLVPFVANQWYKISLLLNWTNHLVDYYVNDAVAYTNIPFRANVSRLTTLHLYNFDYTQAWWDEIQLVSGDAPGAVSISPTNSGNFVNGAWTGNITVLQPATNVVLQADDGSGHTGFSNPFDVNVTNDLSISIMDSPDPVSVGTSLTYTLTVANTGPSAATGVMVTNLLPAGVTFMSATASQGTCSQSAGVVTCNLGTISGGTNATITLVVVPTTAGTTITNLATVSRAEVDPYLGNNLATATTVVTTPAISIGDASVVEGNVGTTSLVFAVTLVAPSAQTITVNYATTDGSATAGSDYYATNGVLTFPPGTTNESLTVTVIGDTTVETDETLCVDLSNPDNGTLGRSQGVGTIINDDGLPGQVDHFAWNPISSPQYVNQPFAATITALDYFNNVATNFSSTVALSATGGNGAGLTNILLFENVNHHYFLSALNELGLNYQAFGPGGEADFNTAVANADVNTTLVVFDVASSFSDFGPITTFVNSGGHAIFAFWALDQQPAVAAAFNVSVVSYYFTPQPVYDWGNSQLFAGLPNPFVLVQGGWGINGDLLNPIAGGTAVAGYTSNPAANQTALVIGNSGRTLLNGFLVDDAQTGSDAVRFAENEIQMLLSGSSSAIPITPTNSANFVNGVWTGNLTVQTRATNATLMANDGNGHVGSSNPFDVIEQIDSLSVSPSDGLVSQGYEGGPFSPSNKVYILSNAGTNALNWSVNCLQTWVPVLTNTSPDAVRVIVINSSQNHRFFRAVASAGGVQPVLSAASCSAGQFQFTLSGQTNASYIIEALTDLQAQAGWVTVDPPGGSLAPGASTNVNVLINASACSLSSGVYAATVAFRNLTSGAVQGRPVSLTVQMLAPAIITQPVSQAVTVGGTANFNVTASGMPPLSYQWRFNGTNIVGATDTTLTLTNVQPAQAGSYTVLVTNAHGLILSSNAVLTVMEGVGVLTTTFANNNSFAGNMFDIMPKANLGITALDVNVSSTAMLQLATVTVFYRSGSSFGHEGSSAGWILLGTRAVTAAGQGVPTHVDLSSNGVEFLQGQTYGLYVYVDYDSGVTMYYTDGTNTYENDVIRLITNCGKGTPPFTGSTFSPRIWNGSIYYATGPVPDTAPVITSQPTDQTVSAGSTASFSVTAYGTAPLSYFWMRNGTPIADANSSNYTTNNVQLADSGSQFSCLVSNALGTALSSNATLFVTAPSIPVFLNGNYLYLPINTNGVFIAASTGGKFNSAGAGGASGVDFWWPGTPVYNYVIGVGGTSYADGNFLSVTVNNLSSGGLQRALIDATVVTGLHFTRDISFATTDKAIKIVDTLQNNGPSTLNNLVTLDSTDPDQDSTAVPSTFSTLNDVVSVNLANDMVVATGPTTGLSLGFGSDSGGQVPSAVGFNNTDAYAYLTVVDPNGASGDIAINLAQNYGSLSPGQSKSVTWYMVFDVSKAAVTNAYAAIGMTNTPPYITSQPTDQTVFTGGTASFGVTAAGTLPLSYQWNFNGTNLSGATNTTLTLTNVQLFQAGNYEVLVTNIFGSALSSNAVLTVDLPSTNCAPAPSGLVGWWQAESNANDNTSTNNGTVTAGSITYTQAEVGLGFNFDGGANRVTVPDAPQLNFSSNQDFSIEVWIQPLANPGNWQDIMSVVDKRVAPDDITQLGYTLFLQSGEVWFQMADVLAPFSFNNFYSGGPDLRDGQFHHVAVTVQRNSTSGGQFYIDGQSVSTFDPTVCPGHLSNTGPLRIGNHATPDLPAFYHGIIDEVSLYNRALSSNEIAAIYNAGSAGKCSTPTAPIILMQPTDQTVFVGGSATFSVTAGGTPPLSYQWNFNGTNIVGATNTSLTLTNVQLNQAGNYAVLVTNASGSILSSNAVLTVNLPPPVPVIIGFSPISGFVGISVTISGINFSPVLSNNIVYFGAVRAVVTAASVTNLVVTVPVGATYAPITETVGGLVAYAGTAFEPTFLGDGSNISPSSFAPRVDLAGGSGSYLTVIADLDGDGKPDLVVANGYDNNISLFRNISTNGPLTINSFAPRVDLPSIGGGIGGLTVADVDGDGKLDLVVSDYSDNQVLVYRNISTVGTLTADSFAAPVAFNVGNSPAAVRVRDLDGDGRPDIACVNFGDDTISILRNIGTAGSLTTNSFAAQVVFATGPSPFDLVLVDLDGDGKPDLAQVNYTPSFLSVFRNVSVQGVIDTNSFAARVDFAASGEGDSIVAGDVDGDGKVDLVAGWAAGSAIAVYRNLSNPGLLDTNSFAPAVDFPVPGWTRSVGLGDLNGDGKPDISLTCEVDSYMCIYQNLSTPGSFTNISLAGRVDYGAGWNPHGVAIGDLDGDGRPDITFGNTYDSTISIYQNVVPFGTISALDHFAWNPIPSPRFVNTPFAVTIRAHNLTNGISTNYTGTAILGTTNGVAVTPSVSGNFVQGVWTGAVVIAQTASNLVLQANDGLGHFGLANPINIISLPSLGMMHSGNIAVYMWPVGYPGFVLETSGSLLAPIAWTVVPYSPVQVGDQYLLPLHMTGTNGYYRLWFPGP